jgi:hypothetical protein
VEKPIRVAFYGDSLFLHGIAKSLEAEPWLEVIYIQPDAPEAAPPGGALGASLLAFDIHEAQPELMLALFKEISDLTLLALDPEGDRLLVLSSQASGARTTGDLMEIIRRYGEAETQRKRGDLNHPTSPPTT